MGVVPKGFASGVKTLASLGAAAAKLFDREEQFDAAACRTESSDGIAAAGSSLTRKPAARRSRGRGRLGLGPGRAARDGLLELERGRRRRP